jgi:hypothetical protein
VRILGRQLLLAQNDAPPGPAPDAKPDTKTEGGAGNRLKETETGKVIKEVKKEEKDPEAKKEPEPKAETKEGDKKPEEKGAEKPEAKPPAKPLPTKLILRLYDIPTGKDVWKKEFPAGSVVIRSDDRDIAGAVQADGKVTLYDLHSLKEDKPIFEAKVDPKFAKNLSSAQIFEDSRSFYLTLNVPLDPLANPGGSYPNIQTLTGMRCTTVNGEVYAFDRVTGKAIWHNEVLQNMLLVDHFRDLPMLLFTARNNQPALKGGGWGGQAVCITSIDKQTGKRIFDKSDLGQDFQQFYAMNVDLKNSRIELVSWQYRLVHTVAPEGGGAADGGAKKDAKPAGSTPTPSGLAPTAVPTPPPLPKP